MDPLADTQADLKRLFGSIPQKQSHESGKGRRKKSVSFDKKSKKKNEDDKKLDALESEGKQYAFDNYLKFYLYKSCRCIVCTIVYLIEKEPTIVVYF